MANRPTRLLFLIHGWTGLAGGAFLLLIALSGALLAFADEIDRFLYPQLWEVKADKHPVSLDSMLTALRTAYPDARGIRVRRFPQRPDLAYEFSMSLKTGPDRFDDWIMAYVDPYTGEVLGGRIARESLREHFMGWVLTLHYSLQARKAGEWVVGLLSILFTVSLISGLLFYRRHILGLLLFRKPLPFRNLRSAFSSLHRLLGVWGLLFNLVMAVTGFWMMRYVFTPAFYSEEAWQPPRDLPVQVSADTVLQRVLTAHPDFIPDYMSLPNADDSGYSIGGKFIDQGFLYLNWSSTIALDRAGRILQVKRIDKQPWGVRLEEMVYALHFGHFGGWPVQLLYLIGGLIPPLLSVTGFYIALRRRRVSRPVRARTVLASRLSVKPKTDENKPELEPSDVGH